MGKDLNLQIRHVILYRLYLFKRQLPTQHNALNSHVAVHLGRLGVDAVGLSTQVQLLVGEMLFQIVYYADVADYKAIQRIMMDVVGLFLQCLDIGVVEVDVERGIKLLVPLYFADIFVFVGRKVVGLGPEREVFYADISGIGAIFIGIVKFFYITGWR